MHVTNKRMNIFSFILSKFVMHVTNKQTSDKFDNGWIFLLNN